MGEQSEYANVDATKYWAFSDSVKARIAIPVVIARELKELHLPEIFIEGNASKGTDSNLLESLTGADLTKQMIDKTNK
ncbi:MAG: hypothetical protein AAF348_14770 [Bacteroidota bacterium]